MAEPSVMIALLESALASNPGVVELSIGDKKVRYDRAQALQELDYWRNLSNSTANKLPMRMFGVRPGAAQ